MRFDYYGTGDSAGESVEGSLARWRDDIGDAIDECRRLTGRERVTLIGLRVGATLAAQAVAARDDVNHLVLYAPVTDAQSLLADWVDAQTAHDRVHGRVSGGAVLSEVLGYPLTDAFRSELRNALVIPRPPTSLRRVLILGEPGADERTRGTATILASAGVAVTVESADVLAIWRREPMEAIVPFKLIRRVVAWMDEASV
jgi:pimeloyl-ACP methyl ester carboxylesterase